MTNLESALSIWEHHVLLKRVAKPKLTSSIFMQYGPHRKHSAWSIAVSDKKDIKMRSIEDLISASSVQLSADFGFVHEPNDFDIDVGLAYSPGTMLGAIMASRCSGRSRLT
jgi:hypothetical protein